MTEREIHLGRLVGRKVRDANGEHVGSIEEIIVEKRGGEWVVTEYLTGPAGMLERLSSFQIGLWLLGRMGASKSPAGFKILWHQLDLGDPAHPRLRCAMDELQRI